MGIASTIGLISGDTNVSAPNTGKVGRDFGRLLQSYLGQSGNIFANEAEYQPQYTDLALRNQTATRAGNMADMSRFSPQVMDMLRKYNPQMTGLMDTLGSQAQSQLDQNGGLDPALQRHVQQDVRSSQAARGLGYGPGDAAMEQFYTDQTREQRRRENQNFAGNVASMQHQTFRDPFAALMGISGNVQAGPSLTGNVMDLLKMPYGGQLQAATSTAANKAGLYNTIDQTSSQFLSSLMGAAGGM